MKFRYWARWWRTARHVPPRQAFALLVTRSLRQRDGQPRLPQDSSYQTSASWDDVRARVREWDLHRADTVSNVSRLLLDRRFRYLNRERQLPDIDWSVQYESPLWTYNLHYFDYAVDLARAWRTAENQEFGHRYLELWNSWLDAASRGSVQLEPYPTSVRCLNALQSLSLVEEWVPKGFADRLLGATYAQLDWLTDNLERHLRGNHLQKNLTALTWGSLAFAGETASSWSRYREELWEELGDQVLLDGTQFERSPMYHAAALEDFLRTLSLCRVAGVPVPDDVPRRLEAMTRALQWLSRPDETLHLFNDAANGERPSRNDVIERARHELRNDFPEPSGMFSLEDAGYFGTVDPEAGLRLVIDAGPLGPSYQPGHAHCDMLSFELDLGGRPVIVDSGVHGYDCDPFREYVRSTRAHNTVTIDGKDQHEMWATFRVARRGEIVEARCREAADGGFEFEGACRHYHARRALHRRSIELRDRQLTVHDQVMGARDRPVASWLHLHPDFRLEATDFGFLAVSDIPACPTVRIEVFGEDESRVRIGEWEPVQGWHCPAFGVAIPAPTIELRARANARFGWRIQLA